MWTVPSIVNEGGRGEGAGDLLLRLREECAINLNIRIEQHLKSGTAVPYHTIITCFESMAGKPPNVENSPFSRTKRRMPVTTFSLAHD